MFGKNQGFTLIELMIVVVIIGILAAIAIPNYVSMQDRARESSVKGNAHTGQLAAEDAAVKNNGIYAGVAVEMNARANMDNPFNPGGDVFTDGPAAAVAGMCYFDLGNPATSYLITANGKDGTAVLTLSNDAN